MIGDDLVDTARENLLGRLNTVLDHYLALLAGHLEHRAGSGETNERTEAQTAFNTAQRIADELGAVYGPGQSEIEIPKAAE